MLSFRVALAAVLLVSAGAAGAWQVGGAPGTLGTLSAGCEDLSAEPITYGMQYDLPGSGLPDEILDIHDIWLAGGCVGCHNQTAMGELRLDDPQFGGSQLVAIPSFRDPLRLRVKPNDPLNSLLYAQINCMPPVEFPLMPPQDGEDIVRIPRRLRAMVYDWIAQGARGVDGDGNPLSEVLFRDSLEATR
jgi:hypothetical protein